MALWDYIISLNDHLPLMQKPVHIHHTRAKLFSLPFSKLHSLYNCYLENPATNPSSNQYKITSWMNNWIFRYSTGFLNWTSVLTNSVMLLVLANVPRHVFQTLGDRSCFWLFCLGPLVYCSQNFKLLGFRFWASPDEVYFERHLMKFILSVTWWSLFWASPDEVYFERHLMKFILSVTWWSLFWASPDEGYCRNLSCALNLISTSIPLAVKTGLESYCDTRDSNVKQIWILTNYKDLYINI